MGTIKIDFDPNEIGSELEISIVIRKDGKVVEVSKSTPTSLPSDSFGSVSTGDRNTESKVEKESPVVEEVPKRRRRGGNMMGIDL